VTQPRAELARLARAVATSEPETPTPQPVADAALVSASERDRVSRAWRLVEQLSRP
jgi:HAMP domain-containing protein